MNARVPTDTATQPETPTAPVTGSPATLLRVPSRAWPTWTHGRRSQWVQTWEAVSGWGLVVGEHLPADPWRRLVTPTVRLLLGPVAQPEGEADSVPAPNPATLPVAQPVAHPATVPGDTADTVALGGDGLPAQAGPQQWLWVLCDDEGRWLTDSTPLLAATTAGQGIALRLLSRSPDGQWHELRRAHRACPAVPQEAEAVWTDTVRELVQQAMLDRSAGVAPSKPARAPRPAPLLPDAALVARLTRRGRRLAWRERQRSRWLSEFWRVGVVEATAEQWLRSGGRLPVRWITPADRRGYWADPMALPGQPGTVFCEYFDERAGLGHVEALTLDDRDSVTSRTRLPVGGGAHASFPLVARIGGRLWGVVESAAARECVLHAVDEQGRWSRVATLLENMRAADPAVFQWEGRYWLALTDLALGGDDNLCLYHARDLRGPWVAHANNPVKRDVRGARMAGPLFESDGALMRPAQDCLGGYGAALAVYRILRLSPTEFEEERVQHIAPDPKGACPDGLHTLSALGQRTLIDGKRLGLNPHALWRKLRERLGAPVRRFAPPGIERVRRIAVYVPHLRMGGGELSLMRLAEGLMHQGVMVDLIVHTMDTAQFKVPEGLQLQVLGTDGTAGSVRQLTRVLRDRQPQCLLSGFPHTNVAAVTAVALSGLHCHCVVTEHAPLTRQIQGQGGWRYRVLPPLVRWAYRRAAAVVAVSTGVRDDLGALVGTALPLHVIGNPVLTDADLADAGVSSVEMNDEAIAWIRSGLDEQSQQERRRSAPRCGHRWLDDDGLDVVLSVSRLSPEKDIPVLIEAFAALAAQRPQARLVIAGEGDDRARLEGLAQASGVGDRIDFTGAIRQPVRWMRRASAFALASRYEGFGNVLIEALAAGCPAVSTDCPVGPREILSNGRWGHLVPVGDAQAMALAIGRALDEPLPRPGARTHALQYTVSRAAGQYRSLMDRLVQER